MEIIWCKERICEPENVEAREDTTAEDIFSRCSNDILNPILTTTNSRGNSGAPSQPAQLMMVIKKLMESIMGR